MTPTSVASSGFSFALKECQDFFLGPFRFQSELDLPELQGVAGLGTLTVTVRLGNVPSSIAEASVIDSACQASSTTYLLDIGDVAKFLVENGRTVTVQPYPTATIANVTAFLLGSIFGALCHQNGMLPLHASAVVVDGKVTAFLGESGAGKSTLAAFLARRGYRIVSDDICLIDLRASSGEGLPVIPVATWLKLWRQSIEQVGEVVEENNRVYQKEDKFRIYLESAHSADSVEARPLALHNVVFLDRPLDDHATTSSSLTPISGVTALARLIDTVYMGWYLEGSGQMPRVFKLCAKILNEANAYRLITPREWNRMDEALGLVEQALLIP